MMNVTDTIPRRLNGLACLIPASMRCGLWLVAGVMSFTSLSAAAQSLALSDSDKWKTDAPAVILSSNLSVDGVSGVSAKEATSVSVTNVAVDDSRSGWKVNVEFDLSEHFAIGAAYVDLQDVELDINSIDNTPSSKLFSPSRKILANSADGFTLESSYHYNLSDNFGLTGSIGLFNWQGGDSGQPLNPNPLSKQSGSDGGTDVYFGLGGGYQLTEEMTLEINFERYKLDNEAKQMWSVGLNYHFK